jgi:hypothetical protein
MNIHSPHDARWHASETGMGKFFSPTNLGRYRSLVDDKTSAAERSQILTTLAEEWGAFTRECRSASPIRAESRTSFCR